MSESAELILTHPILIVCEGGADESFLAHLIEHHGIDGIQVEVPVGGGGVNKYRHFLSALPLTRGYDDLETIVLINDNDLAHHDPFHRLQQEIRESHVGYGVPAQPLDRATVPDYPDLIGMLIPWSDERGNLEVLILRAFADTWPDVKAAADEYMAKTPASGWNADEQAISTLQCMIAAICKKDPHCSLRFIWSQPVFRDVIKHAAFNRVAEFLSDVGY